jgi:hypothetical protein
MAVSFGSKVSAFAMLKRFLLNSTATFVISDTAAANQEFRQKQPAP